MRRIETRQIVFRSLACLGVLALSVISCAENNPYSLTKLGDRTVSVKGNGAFNSSGNNARRGIWDLDNLCSIIGISRVSNYEFIVNTKESNCPVDLSAKSAYHPRTTCVIDTPNFSIVQISKNVTEINGLGWSAVKDQNLQEGLDRVLQACPDGVVSSSGETSMLVVSQLPNCACSIQ